MWRKLLFIIIAVSISFVGVRKSTAWYNSPPVAVLRVLPDHLAPNWEGGDVIAIFDGNDSTDDGHIVKYEWDFHYNGTTFNPEYTETADNAPDGNFDGFAILKRQCNNCSGPFTQAGTYQVRLRVTDNGPMYTMYSYSQVEVTVSDDFAQYDCGCFLDPSIAAWSSVVTYGKRDFCTYIDNGSGVNQTYMSLKSGNLNKTINQGGILLLDPAWWVMVSATAPPNSSNTMWDDQYPYYGGLGRTPKYVKAQFNNITRKSSPPSCQWVGPLNVSTYIILKQEYYYAYSSRCIWEVQKDWTCPDCDHTTYGGSWQPKYTDNSASLSLHGDVWLEGCSHSGFMPFEGTISSCCGANNFSNSAGCYENGTGTVTWGTGIDASEFEAQDCFPY